MYAEFQEGNFAVKRTSGSFNMLPSDQVIEQTINKGQKGPRGIIGYTTSTGSVQRWVFSSHVIAKINANLQSSIDIAQSSNSVKDLGKKRKFYDEQKVQDCYSLFANCNNPYQFSEELISVNSGAAVAAEIKEDLLKTNEVGKKYLKNFIDKRIKKNEQNLNNPIKKNMLLTIESIEKKTASKSKGITAAWRSDQDTFAWFLLIQKDRDIDLKETMQFELTPLPLSFANADGKLLKTVKSKLFAELSKSIPQVTLLLENTVSIFDGMLLFQKLPSTLVPFGDIGD